MPKASPFAAFAHKRLSYWSGNLVKIMGFHRFNRLMAVSSVAEPAGCGRFAQRRFAAPCIVSPPAKLAREAHRAHCEP
jgi:hypothetical protein